MLDHEREAEQNGYRSVAGVDEAGRGPLAGPVVAAAVVLPKEVSLPGLRDSKKLSPASREQWFVEIKNRSLGWSVAVVDESTIDEINILQATLLAMKQAVGQLSVLPDLLLIDGNRGIDSGIDQKTIVGGDDASFSIAAASVLAKVTRDRLMDRYHQQYPEYEFSRHKGYGTRLHRERIRQYGPCPVHRKTFKGVAEYLDRRP
ncbi:MAG: ribonuclease HII [Nitrospinota bacterium]|nr:ribonuclease HII [Nitrospinota bacterium]